MRRTLPLLLLFAACAKDPQLTRWESDYYHSEKLATEGQHDLARQRFAVLRVQAKNERDADEAALMECETQAQQGRQQTPGGKERRLSFVGATACYDTLAESARDRELRARAFLHAAELRYEELDQQPAALRQFTQLCDQAPDTAAALRALDHLTLHARTSASHRNTVLLTLADLQARQPRSELADNLLLRMATLLGEEGSPPSLLRGAELLERLERDHPTAPTLIDALSLRAGLYRRLDRPREEARDLQRIVETYETSYMFASYSLNAHKDACLRLIELERGPLLDLAKAEEHARHLPEMLRWPVRMLGYLKTLAEIQEQRGKTAAALATWQELLRYWQWRHDDYIANDERICREEPNPEDRKACMALIPRKAPVETREVADAREAIARLQGKKAAATEAAP
jgi:tetratricopeptide (TPR) repeat protein